MILRYQQFIQRLNNIQKVCMTAQYDECQFDLGQCRAPLRRSLHGREVRVGFRVRLLGELAQAITGTTKEHHDANDG